MPHIHFETLGCKVNQIESESAARAFMDSGFTADSKAWTAQENTHEETLICVINTCTVTAKAEQKARRIIRLMLDLCPKACILVTGCYAQLDGEDIQKISPRIAILPGQKKDILADLPEFLKKQGFPQNISQNNVQSNTYTKADKITEVLKKFINNEGEKLKLTNFKLSTDTFLQHSRPSIKIQDGCNNSCTFCRIHFARGKSVSLSPNDVLTRVQKLENLGHSEVVITGINLSQYLGIDNGKTYNLPKLFEYILENTKTIHLRLSSLYPQSITDEFCNIIKNPRFQSHFHLSVQSGSDDILIKMGRPYRHDDVVKAVENLRNAKPNAFIACDIIAGFPGETEEDFQKTLELCEKCRFTWIHAFPFSPRPGTQGEKMKPKIPQYIAGQRIKLLTNLATANKDNYVESLIGKTFFAVIENRKSKIIRGVTENFLHVHITNTSNTSLSGKVLVKITGKSIISGCDAEAFLVNS